MVKRKANWQDILIACLLTIGMIYGVFWLKVLTLQNSEYAAAVALKPLVYGSAAGLAISLGGVFLLKKHALAPALAAGFLALWLLLPLHNGLDSVLLGVGLACVFVSVPHVAALLAQTHSERT